MTEATVYPEPVKFGLLYRPSTIIRREMAVLGRREIFFDAWFARGADGIWKYCIFDGICQFLNFWILSFFPRFDLTRVIDNGFRDCADFWEEKISYICSFLNFFYWIVDGNKYGRRFGSRFLVILWVLGRVRRKYLVFVIFWISFIGFDRLNGRKLIDAISARVRRIWKYVIFMSFFFF